MTIHTAGVGGKMYQQNLAPFSIYSSVEKYITGDLVVYSTQIWQASTNSLGNTPTSTSTAWVSVLSGGGGAPGGSDTQFQYNSSGTFVGSSELTRTASNTVTISTGASLTFPAKFGSGTSQVIHLEGILHDSNDQEGALLIRDGGTYGEFSVVISSTYTSQTSFSALRLTNGYSFVTGQSQITNETNGVPLSRINLLDGGMEFRTKGSGGTLALSTDSFFPGGGDNVTRLGAPGFRWSKVYITLTTPNPAVLGQLWVTTSGVVMCSTGP